VLDLSNTEADQLALDLADCSLEEVAVPACWRACPGAVGG